MIEKLVEALKRATRHSVKSDWYCGSCSVKLRKWIDAGMDGEIPEPCLLCKRDEAQG